jgi:hypothetical protein
MGRLEIGVDFYNLLRIDARRSTLLPLSRRHLSCTPFLPSLLLTICFISSRFHIFRDKPLHAQPRAPSRPTSTDP